MSRFPKIHSGPFVWKVPGFPEITMGERAMHGIALDVLDVFGRVPRRGAETGGILLGTRDGQHIAIEGYAPIPSEHRFGRLYQLSPSDRQNLREALEAVNGKPGGLRAV